MKIKLFFIPKFRLVAITNTRGEHNPFLYQSIDGNQEKMSEDKIQNVIDKLWLNYYNGTMSARGLISETNRNLIDNCKHKARAKAAER